MNIVNALYRFHYWLTAVDDTVPEPAATEVKFLTPAVPAPPFDVVVQRIYGKHSDTRGLDDPERRVWDVLADNEHWPNNMVSHWRPQPSAVAA